MPPSFRTNPRRYVLDANALIGFFEGTPSVSDKVRRLLGESLRHDLPLLMSAVNWGEVFYLEWRFHGEAKAHEAEARVQEMPIAIIAVDRERASRAGALKQKHGLGYTDAFAAELPSNGRHGWLPPTRNSPRWERRSRCSRCRDIRGESERLILFSSGLPSLAPEFGWWPITH